MAVQFRKFVTGAIAVSSALAISLPGIAQADNTPAHAAKHPPVHHHKHHHHSHHRRGTPHHNGGPSDGDGNL